MSVNVKRVSSRDEYMADEVSYRGKVVYQPPERCYTNVYIKETPHGLLVSKKKGERHFLVIPWSKVVQIQSED
jgi:hypothetical protein|tara:strand:+ start:12997 stop:13215 length:219 start_codon:yes stop_codon:yes gene_type:complete